ncbi:MAG: hypothetical protein R3C56_22820 [Pirellulaceae bacterium]
MLEVSPPTVRIKANGAIAGMAAAGTSRAKRLVTNRSRVMILRVFRGQCGYHTSQFVNSHALLTKPQADLAGRTDGYASHSINNCD